jgi:hypothetical protein
MTCRVTSLLVLFSWLVCSCARKPLQEYNSKALVLTVDSLRVTPVQPALLNALPYMKARRELVLYTSLKNLNSRKLSIQRKGDNINILIDKTLHPRATSNPIILEAGSSAKLAFSYFITYDVDTTVLKLTLYYEVCQGRRATYSGSRAVTYPFFHKTMVYSDSVVAYCY